jgi:hypothetical protein
MIHGTIRQFLEQVEWGDLDYLIVDLPPGTGDVPLTLSQSIPMTGAVIVCTPQDVALLDAVRAARMYQQLNVQVLGFVENMSYFIAPDTGKEYDLFGKGGVAKAAERLGVPFLGSVPINVSIRGRRRRDPGGDLRGELPGSRRGGHDGGAVAGRPDFGPQSRGERTGNATNPFLDSAADTATPCGTWVYDRAGFSRTA